MAQRISLIIGAALAALPTLAQSQEHGSQPGNSSQPARASVYAPYQPLIGEWDIVPRGGDPVSAQSRFCWGTGQSYIWFATSIAVNGRQQPHFEGMLVWNGANRNLEMLLSIDLGGGQALERGVLNIAPDGSFVREIVAVYGEGQRLPDGSGRAPAVGATVNFRQTFRALDANRMETSLMRRTPSGWVPTFPGSDRLEMVRRAVGGPETSCANRPH